MSDGIGTEFTSTIGQTLRYAQGKGIGYVIDAINEDYAGRSQATPAQAPPGPARASESREEAVARAKAKKAQEDTRKAQDEAVKDYLNAMTPTQQEALDDRLLADRPDLRDGSPMVRRLALIPMRQESIGALLAFPGGPS